jgi:hypothetical protein
VAISNHRLISLEDGKVTFRWKDYAHGGKKRKMTLDASECCLKGWCGSAITDGWPTVAVANARCNAGSCWESNRPKRC